jgi:hypothetical protein
MTVRETPSMDDVRTRVLRLRAYRIAYHGLEDQAMTGGQRSGDDRTVR